jgi:hypothetical protein
MSRGLVEQFIASFREAPAEWILDFAATDDRVHGLQEGRFFHGDGADWCFLPLDGFCGEQLLVSYLRPSGLKARAKSSDSSVRCPMPPTHGNERGGSLPRPNTAPQEPIRA